MPIRCKELAGSFGPNLLKIRRFFIRGLLLLIQLLLHDEVTVTRDKTLIMNQQLDSIQYVK
jgi:hypothetical protein